jgi:hypothetical protein
MPHPSEYGNGCRPTLADVRSGAATYQDYIARLGEEQPPAAESSTPATSSLIVAKSSSDVTRVRKINARSPRQPSAESIAAQQLPAAQGTEIARRMAKHYADKVMPEMLAQSEPPSTDDNPDYYVCSDVDVDAEQTKTSAGVQVDGHHVFYRGKDHMVFGASEAAKSLWVTINLLFEIRRPVQIDGCEHGFRFAAGYERTPEYCEHEIRYPTAVYVHFEESNPAETVKRLKAFGATRDELSRVLFMSTATRPMTKARLDRTLDSHPDTTFLLLDGVKSACGGLGVNVMDDGAVSAYRAAYVTYATSAGKDITTVSIHHPVKDVTRQGERAPYGAGGWLETVRGATYRVDAGKTAITKGARGYSEIYVVKDTPGDIRSWATPDASRGTQFAKVATLEVDDTRERASVTEWRMLPAKVIDRTVEATQQKLADAIEVTIAKRDGHVRSQRALFGYLREDGHKFDEKLAREVVDMMIDRHRLAKEGNELVIPDDGATGHSADPTDFAADFAADFDEVA